MNAALIATSLVALAALAIFLILTGDVRRLRETLTGGAGAGPAAPAAA